MPYRAQGGGPFGGTIPNDTRPQVDVGGILDALGSGATSLVQANLAKNQTLRQNALQQGQINYERQQQQNEMAFRKQQFAAEQAQRNVENTLATTAAAAKATQDAGLLDVERHKAGYVPESTVPGTLGVGPTDVRIMGGGPILGAMGGQVTAPTSGVPMPIQWTTPQGVTSTTQLPAMAPAPAPASPIQQAMTVPGSGLPAVPGRPDVTTPAHYDRSQSDAGIAAQGRLTIAEYNDHQRAILEGTKNANRQSATVAANAFRERMAKLTNNLATQKDIAVKGSQSYTEAEKIRQDAANDLEAQFSGDPQQVHDYLASPDGQAQYGSLGIQGRHLDAGATKYFTDRRKEIESLEKPGLGSQAGTPLTPPQAAKRVDDLTPVVPPTPPAGAKKDTPAMQTWRTTHPAMKGETADQYYARNLAGVGGSQ